MNVRFVVVAIVGMGPVVVAIGIVVPVVILIVLVILAGRVAIAIVVGMTPAPGVAGHCFHEL